MAVRIEVQTTALSSASGRVASSMGTDYSQAVNRLYATLRSTNQTWRGVDNTAFITQIDSCKPSLDGVSEITDAYVTMLNTARTSYEATQNSVTGMANKLPNGQT